VSELKQGESLPELRVTPDAGLTKRYAEASGDPNPIHTDAEFAKSVGLPGVIAHGMLQMGLLANLAVDAAGGAFALFAGQTQAQQNMQLGYSLFLARRAPSGAWAAPVEITVVPEIAVGIVISDAAGYAQAFWSARPVSGMQEYTISQIGAAPDGSPRSSGTRR